MPSPAMLNYPPFIMQSLLKDTFELAITTELQFLPSSYIALLFIAGSVLGVGAAFLAVHRFLSKVN